MRRFTAAIVVAASAAVVAACGGGNHGEPSSSTTTTTSTKPPIAQPALAGLLLTPAEIDTLFGVTGTKSKVTVDKLQDDVAKQATGPGAVKLPDECDYILGPAEAPVYANSGNTAVSGDDDTTSLGDDQDVEVGQALVLFPSAKEASDFFNASAQRWPACASRQIDQPATADGPESSWKVGPFANSNGTLSVTPSVSIGGPTPMTISAQRALTVRNNVIVDVVAVRKDPADFAVKVANQIADKVAKQ